ncbi:hypothetical protein M378DRAFT_82691, partial [Amanita muscaria Koide BX008]
QILSHHVDDFTLISAFLFAIGCLNMLLGLIFHEFVKEKRSIRTWRAEAKVLSQSTGSDGHKKFMLTSKGGAPCQPTLRMKSLVVLVGATVAII